MEDESGNRRLLLATALCFLVWLVWLELFPPAKPPAPESNGSGQMTQTASVAPTLEQAKTSTTSVRVVAASPTANVERKEFRFEGLVKSGAEEVPYRVTLTNIGGGVDSFTLPSYKERNQDNEATDNAISIAEQTASLQDDDAAAFMQMAGIGFAEGTTFKHAKRLVFEVAEESEDRVRYRHVTGEGVEIEREYKFQKDSFEIEMAVTVRNNSKTTQEHALEIHSALQLSEAMKQGGGFFSNFIPPADQLSALCFADGEVERELHQELKDAPVSYSESVQWVAMDRRYFVSAIISRDRSEPKCVLRSKENVYQAALVMPKVSLKPGDEERHKFTAYLGVKKQDLLTLADANLEQAVDYKLMGLNLAPLCTFLLWILRLIHSATGSWGLAILGLTFLVKLVLFPLNQRSGKSMRALAALRPQMDQIRSKFPDDRQRQSEEMMKLYRKYNVNPAGGCLPVLLQMPIWIALYRALFVSVDLYQQGFLWIADLTTRDPYWILPVGLVVVMFLQQKMTPTTMDPAQQKMMQYTMPLVFGAMMMALPAGLCFYILVNTLLTIVQQHFINKSIGPIGGSAAVQEAKT